MRVIAGIYKSRYLTAPKGRKTHPMSEKMRGALFLMLGDIVDLTVLDAYAGSGAIGIEALSRGAKYVQLIDNDKKAFKAIKTNLESLEIDSEQIIVTKANSISWVKNNIETKFDIVIADPPYNQINREHLRLLANQIDLNGTFVMSLPLSERLFDIDGLKLASSKNYGDGTLHIYKKIK